MSYRIAADLRVVEPSFERDLRGDDVARPGHAVLERHPAHPVTVGVVDLRAPVVELERAGVLDLRLEGDGLVLEGRGDGHHLEHRPGLVDARDDRVDEPVRRVRRDLAVLVGVVGRIGGLGVDLPGVRVHDDGRHALGLVGDPRGEEFLLDRQLEAGVDGRPDVLARRPVVDDLGRIEQRPPVRVAVRDHDLRVARQRRLVGLLDPVLALPVAVDEAQQLRRQGRVGSAARLRIDAHRLRLERDAEEPLGRDPVADLSGERRGDAPREDDVRLVARELVAQGHARDVVEAEEADELVAGLVPLLGVHVRRRGHEPVAIDGRGEDHGPAAVVDVAAMRRLGDLDRRLGDGLRGEHVALRDLPVREPPDERERARRRSR